MNIRVGSAIEWLACAALLCMLGCGDDDDGAADPDAGARPNGGAGTHADASPHAPAGEHGDFLALSYNVAGLPMGLSSSMPELFTPMIGPLLNGYDVVLLQESWQTPDPNPGDPLRVYHEILVEASEHPYKSEPAEVPWMTDPDRPSALLGDGLNVFSDFPIDETVRVRWETCVESESDCLALKGFSMTRMHLTDDVAIDVYDLHMEAGGTDADDTARAQGLQLLADFIAEHSAGQAVIVGGDFNLRTDREPAATQFAQLLSESGLTDACTDRGCDRPGSIDKFLFRSSDRVELGAESLSFETDVFVSAEGEPLSDHDPLAVRFAWSAAAE